MCSNIERLTVEVYHQVQLLELQYVHCPPFFNLNLFLLVITHYLQHIYYQSLFLLFKTELV